MSDPESRTSGTSLCSNGLTRGIRLSTSARFLNVGPLSGLHKDRSGPSLASVPDLPIRTVEVVPPSKSNESVSVLLVSGAIVLVALYAIAARTGLGARSAQADSLPFQMVFQDLPGPEQRIVRELTEGFAEAKRVRGVTGKWPAPADLARDQIPPFAEDALDRARYQWSLKQERLLFNYLGTPASEGSPEFLLVVQEPEPAGGETAVAGVVDEEHELLPDGKLLHVTYWRRKFAAGPEVIYPRPEIEGWTQIRLGTAKETPR